MDRTILRIDSEADPSTLAEFLSYDPVTGQLIWRRDCGQRGRAGTSAGYKDARYWRLQFDGRAYLAHRVAWCLMTGQWPKAYIDHRDGDGFNNAWSNLREADRSENQANKGLSASNTSGVKGVSWHKQHQKWYARITLRGVSHVLGLYESLQAAAEAVAKKRLQLHKEFANHG